jgi:hypothetical protein
MTEDRDALIRKHRAQCTCEPCPSYNECMRAEESLLFCIAGKAENCTFEKKGCLCPSCLVTRELGLNKSYYCIRGTQQEQG